MDSDNTKSESLIELPETTINKNTDEYWSGVIKTSNGSQNVTVYNIDDLMNSE